MTRRRLNRKPTRFIRNSKRLVMKRFKLRGGLSEEEYIKKLSDYGVKFANLRTDSGIIGIKAEIAIALNSGGAEAVVKAEHNKYTAALTKLIDDSVNAARNDLPDDQDVKALQTKVANLKAIVLAPETDRATYYELNDIYIMITDFFAQKSQKAMKMMADQ